MTRFRKSLEILLCVMVMAGLLMTTGCSYWSKKESVSRAGGSGLRAKRGTPAVYHDFGDVLIPKDLKVDRKSTFVYQTAGFAGGVLSLKGRVDLTSLVDFFDRNMVRDNWNLVSRFKSPRTIMLFHKENKWCVISISEGDFSTYVEIWVAPTVENAGGGMGGGGGGADGGLLR